MTRVGFITWSSKGFTVAATAPRGAEAAAPARRSSFATKPQSGPERVRRTKTKELSRR